MKTSTQKPTNADGDLSGSVLAFNRVTKRWYVVTWNAVEQPLWTDWQPLPPAPSAEAATEGS